MRRQAKPPRGAAALEFAFVVPLYLILALGIFYMGWAMTVMFRIGNIANTAVRTCVARQYSTDSPAAYGTCATEEFNRSYAAQGQICAGAPQLTVAPPQPMALAGVQQVAGVTNRLYLLQLKAQCTLNLGALSAFVPNVGTSVPLVVNSAAPYVVGPQ